MAFSSSMEGKGLFIEYSSVVEYEIVSSIGRVGTQVCIGYLLTLFLKTALFQPTIHWLLR